MTAAGWQVPGVILAERNRLPRIETPLTTPEYLAHCQAIYRGDYRAAKQHAEAKLLDLEQ